VTNPLQIKKRTVVKVSHASSLLVVSLSYLSYVFQIFHRTFWTSGLGDWMDPYFINYLLEHWYHSLSTFSDPSSPPMYFPVQKMLGYSHGLILYAPFYLPIRPFFHPFQADSLSLFVVLETGILCLYLIFRKFFELSFIESLLLTVFFFTSQNVINKSVGIWSQRASVFLIPLILLILLASVRRRDNPPRLILSAVSGFLATLLFTHDFYSAHFTLFFVVLFLAAALFVESQPSVTQRISDVWRAQRLPMRVAVVAAVLGTAWTCYVWKFGGGKVRLLGLTIVSQDWRRPGLFVLACIVVLAGLRGGRRIKADLLVARPWLRAFIFGAIAGSAVFVWIYLPAYREHRSFPEQDLLNSLVVRDPSRWTGPFAAIRDLRAYTTLRPFKLVGLLAVAAWIPWFNVDRRIRLYCLWAVAVSVVVLVIPLNVADFSIWLMFFRHLPGFGVIRDPTRIIYLYELAVVLAAGLFLTRFRQKPVWRMCVCPLLLFFIVTDHNRDVFGYERPVNVYRRWVAAPIDIERSCKSFYIKGASDQYMSRSPHTWSLYNIDAMFVSLNDALPTLNGYSAWYPEGWNLLNPPEEADYADAVRRWIVKYELKSVCEFDIDARTMRVVTAPQ
jgi:hypothetical protein